MENVIFNLVLSERGFANNTLRGFLVSLDYVAFFLFQHVMQLLFDLIKVTVTDDLYRPLYDRVYVILAIYMLFKVTISILSYIVNPDVMTDKNQGAGKLVTRIVVSLSLLAVFPSIFTKLGEIQEHLISNNTIPNLVLGPGSDGINDDDKKIFGASLGWSIYDGTFIAINGDKDGNPTGLESFEEVSDKINDGLPGDAHHYNYDYIPIVGFVLGIVLTIVSLGLCVDVAMRVFKLMILQIIAPIPILSYIDPKSSKDGAFSKWLKTLITVWVDIFLRMAIVFFMLLIIQRMIVEGNGLGGVDSDGLQGAFVKIALIIGLLFFAKSAPKFIYDALGMKAPERGIFAGVGNILAAGAIGAGMLSGAISSGSASWNADAANEKGHNPLSFMKNVGAGLFGGVGGLATGVGAASNAKDHNAKAVFEAMRKRNDATIAAGSAGSTMFGRAGSTLSRMLTGQTAAMRGERQIARMEAQKNALSNVKSRVSSEMVKKDWTSGNLGIKDSSGKDIMANYKSFMASKNAAATAGLDKFSFLDSKGVSQTISMEQANMQEGFLLKNNEDDYLKSVISGAQSDETLSSLIEIASSAGSTITDRSSVTDAIDSLGIEITRAKNRNETNKQNDRFAGSK